MKNAILVHGWTKKPEYLDKNYPTPSNSHWLPWLSKQLMIRDIHTVAIEMPRGYHPDYGVWRRELERFDIGPETVLVGHSCGGGFLVRWLSETSVKIKKAVLVAPWLGYDLENRNASFDETFFDFKINPQITNQVDEFIVFNSTDDMGSVQQSVRDLRNQLDGMRYIELENKGHFTLKSLGGEEFPELLAEIIR